MGFEIPDNLGLSRRGHTTLIRAHDALEKHEPDRAARLLQRAKVASSEAEIARDLMLAVTLSHCNLPEKALKTVMNSLLTYRMTDEQQLFHRIVEGELLSTLGKVRQALKVLDQCADRAASMGRKDLAIEALIREGVAYSALGNQDTALLRLEQSLSLAMGVSEQRLVTRALAEKSRCLFRSGDLVASLGIAKEAVETSDRDDRSGRALGYRQIGMVHGALYRFFESLEAHRNALNVYNTLAQIPGQIGEYLSLAETYVNMGDIGLATHFTDKARLLAEDGDNPIMLAAVYSGLGRLSLATGAFSQAGERFGKQLTIAQKQESDIFLAGAERHVGIVEMFVGNLQHAAHHFLTAGTALVTAGDITGANEVLWDLSQIAPFLDAPESEAVTTLRNSMDSPDDHATNRQPSTMAKAYFVEAFTESARHNWRDAVARHDAGVDLLLHYGCFLEATLALYRFGNLAMAKNVEVACEMLERALKLSDIHGFYDLSRIILGTIGTIEGRGEEVVLEYSLDKAAVRQLGDDGSLQDEASRITATHIVGSSPQLMEVLREIERFAPTDLPVLILGPSGTGKELVARRTHELSKRVSKPFLPINCATLPATIIDAELFGSLKGAYTHSTSNRNGLILQADQGTLFLDEIGEFPLALQPKLLRFLQEGEVRPVGSDRTHTVDVRIVAATNADLARAVEAGSFREDLFYRLNVVPLTLPSLSERGRDIIDIARFLVERNPLARQKGLEGISRAAATALLEHPWPGNIRELENVIQTAIVRADQPKIMVEDLRLPSARQELRVVPMTTEPSALPSSEPVDIKSREEVMFESIKRALEATDGNQSEAALKLNIHRNTLRNWIKKMKREGVL